jgi:hypothetical protein
MMMIVNPGGLERKWSMIYFGVSCVAFINPDVGGDKTQGFARKD